MAFPQIQNVDGNGSVIGIAGASKIHFDNLVGTVLPIKTSAGILFGLYVLNTTAATCFVQVFDALSASAVTLGTTSPDEQISCLTVSAAFLPIPSAFGVAFSRGIWVASTTAVSGNSASASGVYVYATYA